MCRMVSGRRHCYEKLPSTTAQNAHETCQDRGMYLAKVDSEEEFEFLRNLIAEGAKHICLKEDNFAYYYYTLGFRRILLFD